MTRLTKNKRGGFDKPSDLALMVFVFVMIMFVVGLGIQSTEKYQNSTQNTKVNLDIAGFNESIDDLIQAREGGSEGLVGIDGGGSFATENNLIVASFQSVRSLGQTWTTAQNQTSRLVTTFGIDPTVLTLGLGMLLIVFAVVTYAWLRGRG